MDQNQWLMDWCWSDFCFDAVLHFQTVLYMTFEHLSFPGRSQTWWRLSKFSFCFSLNFQLWDSSRYGHGGIRFSTICGSEVRMLQPIKSSAGDLPHQVSWVALYFFEKFSKFSRSELRAIVWQDKKVFQALMMFLLV